MLSSLGETFGLLVVSKFMEHEEYVEISLAFLNNLARYFATLWLAGTKGYM